MNSFTHGYDTNKDSSYHSRYREYQIARKEREASWALDFRPQTGDHSPTIFLIINIVELQVVVSAQNLAPNGGL